MFTNPNLATQLAREHHRQMLTQASRRHQHGRPVPGTPNIATSIIRRLAAVITRADQGVPAERTV